MPDIEGKLLFSGSRHTEIPQLTWRASEIVATPDGLTEFRAEWGVTEEDGRGGLFLSAVPIADGDSEARECREFSDGGLASPEELRLLASLLLALAEMPDRAQLEAAREDWRRAVAKVERFATR